MKLSRGRSIGFIPVLSAACFLLVGAVHAQPRQDPPALVRRAAEARLSEDWYGAIELYLAALEINPTYSDAVTGLAEAYYSLEEYEQALVRVTEARRLQGDAPGLLVMEAFIRIGLGDASTAAELFRSVLSKYPNDLETRFGLALLETVEKVVHDHQHDHEIFDSAVQHLRLMDKEPETCKVAFVRFLLAITDILGYRLETSKCPRCQAPLTGAVYNPANAQLICLECGRQFSSGHRLSEADVTFFKETGIGEQSEVNQDKLLWMLIHYLSYHLDVSLNLKSLQLLSDLKI